MKRYLLPCDCSASVPVTTGQAGDHVRCPRCGASLPVPRLGGFGRLVEAGDGDPAVARRGGGSWTVGHALLLAGLAVMLLSATAAAIVQATSVITIDEESIRAAFRSGGITDIHQAAQALARQGVVRPLSPDETRLLRTVGVAAVISRLLWGVAAGGAALAAAGGIAIARRRARPAA